MKSYISELWNYVLLMYRTMLIRAESRRRKAIGYTENWKTERRKSTSNLHLHSHQNHHVTQYCRKNGLMNGDHHVQVNGDHHAATTYNGKMCRCDRLEMRRVFDLFDENKDGLISAKELQLYMKKLGFDLSDQKVRNMVRTVDKNRDEYVDFEEFFSMYSSPGNVGDAGDSKSNHHDHSSRSSSMEEDEEDEEETLLKAFFVFDENKDGFISRFELQQVLLKLGLPEGRSLKGCQRMIQKVDADGNGMVDFFEFRRMMRSNSFVFCR
ncbi:unnamed protein product [Calypogeia fissa]